MATKDVTGKKVGSTASRILRNSKSSGPSKSVAGSALVQRPTKRK